VSTARPFWRRAATLSGLRAPGRWATRSLDVDGPPAPGRDRHEALTEHWLIAYMPSRKTGAVAAPPAGKRSGLGVAPTIRRPEERRT